MVGPAEFGVAKPAEAEGGRFWVGVLGGIVYDRHTTVEFAGCDDLFWYHTRETHLPTKRRATTKSTSRDTARGRGKVANSNRQHLIATKSSRLTI